MDAFIETNLIIKNFEGYDKIKMALDNLPKLKKNNIKFYSYIAWTLTSLNIQDDNEFRTFYEKLKLNQEKIIKKKIFLPLTNNSFPKNYQKKFECICNINTITYIRIHFKIIEKRHIDLLQNIENLTKLKEIYFYFEDFQNND